MVTSNTYGYTITFNGIYYLYNASNLWGSNKQVLFFAGGLDPSKIYPVTVQNYDSLQPQLPTFYASPGLSCFNIDGILTQKGAVTSA